MNQREYDTLQKDLTHYMRKSKTKFPVEYNCQRGWEEAFLCMKSVLSTQYKPKVITLDDYEKLKIKVKQLEETIINLENAEIEQFKPCHQCDGLMNYDPYFKAYVCTTCGKMDRTPVTKTHEATCQWIRYDHRTMCPKKHDIENPYWRIPENRMDALIYCPYCGKKIKLESD